MRYLLLIVASSVVLLTATATGAEETAAPAAKDKAKSNRGKEVPLRDQFMAADADKNGQVSLEEIRAKNPKFPEARFQQMDKNGDGVVERRELPKRPPKKKPAASRPNEDRMAIIAYASRLIERFDQDGNGSLTLAELQSAKPGFPPESFAPLDRNKDGQLDQADFPGAEKTDNPVSKAPASMGERLRKADTDKDGRLTFEEAKTAFPEITKGRFQARDRNGDGFLSPEDRNPT